MKHQLMGLVALRVSLPLSASSRQWRMLSRRLRGKQGAFLHATTLPEVAWRDLGLPVIPRLCESGKANGNVRLRELGILSALGARAEAATNLFEIGTFDGRTSLNLALNAPPTCNIYTLDLPPQQPTKYGVAPGEQHMIEKPESGARYKLYRDTHPAVVSRIHQMYGDSATFDYAPFKDSCSLVFVDGSHAYEYAVSDTRAAMTMVRKGGCIVWHDYGVWPGVTQALEEIEQRDRLGLRHIRGTSLAYWQRP